MNILDMQAFSGAGASELESALMAAAISGIAAILILALVLLIAAIIMGILCRKLARHKGYTGYFWMGFFLGVIALIYVVGLPDLNARKDMRAMMKRLVSVNDRLTTLEDRQFQRQY